jgi:beta-glucanase (GH16 family)
MANGFIIKLKLLVIIILTYQVIFGQPSPASCVHSGGISFYLDAYLASLGACDCLRSVVILTSFPKCDNNPYLIDFEDNFGGDTLDLNKWQLSPSAQSNLEGGQSLELRTLNNVSVKKGICSIIAKKETVINKVVNYKPDNEILNDGKPNLRTFNYTSSLLVSKNSFYHGKYEIRCKMPVGNGFWPAFWIFGGERYNEIDIFDSYKGSNKIVSGMFHDYNGDRRLSGCGNTYNNFNLSEWHTYSCTWESDQITFCIDDKPIDIIYRVLTSAGEPVLCDDNIGSGTFFQLASYPLEPMKIIFNLAIISKNGPADSVPVDDSTPFPGSFDIDYIRFWKKTAGDVSIYPNPVREFVIVDSKTTILSVSINNLNGQIIYSAEINALSARIDLSMLPTGFYVLTAKLDGISKRIKIIKTI